MKIEIVLLDVKVSSMSVGGLSLSEPPKTHVSIEGINIEGILRLLAYLQNKEKPCSPLTLAERE